MSVIGHTVRFHPKSDHGESHEDNESFPCSLFYFSVRGTGTGEGLTGTLQGYVTRAEFNHLAALLNLATLTDEQVTK